MPVGAPSEFHWICGGLISIAATISATTIIPSKDVDTMLTVKP